MTEIEVGSIWVSKIDSSNTPFMIVAVTDYNIFSESLKQKAGGIWCNKDIFLGFHKPYNQST